MIRSDSQFRGIQGRRGSLLVHGAVRSFSLALAGSLLCSPALLAGDGTRGLPDHPRVAFQQSEIEYLKANLNDPLFAEAWAETKKAADKPRGPDIQKDYDFTDARELYAGPLSVDAFDILYFGTAYALTGDIKYADQAAKWMAGIERHVDVTYKSGLEWWDTIVWDLMGMRLVMGLDLIWNTLDAAEQQSFGNWLATLSSSVRVLHERDTNGRYYKDNLASGNIKSWDNALIGCTGFLIGDREAIEYAIDSSDNDVVREGVRIEMHYRAKIRHDIVEVWSGDNSQYGPFRTVDWERAIQDKKDYPESIGYQQYHQRANEYLAKAALRHGLDLYRFAARRHGSDQRHHSIQPIVRAGLFSTRVVPAEHNAWRTWDGKKWYYSEDDIEGTGRGSSSQAGFCNEVGSPELDGLRAHMDEVIRGGLRRGSRSYADFHTLGYTWPFQLVNVRKGLEAAGDVSGTVQFEAQPSGDSEITLYRAAHRLRSLMRTPVEVDADGRFDALAMPVDSYWAIARSPGFKSSLGLVDVRAGRDNTLPVVLQLGEHEILPRNAVYLAPAELPYLTLRTGDPQGLASTGGRPYFFAETASGQLVELIRTAPGLFEVLYVDANRFEVRVEVSNLRRALGNPTELRVLWVMVQSDGIILAADGHYFLTSG